MRNLSTDRVGTHRRERSVAGLTGRLPAAEGIPGRRSYFSRAETHAAEQVSDTARQPGNRIHRMHNHIGGGGHRTYSARGQRLGEHAGITHAIELGDSRDLGETGL